MSYNILPIQMEVYNATAGTRHQDEQFIKDTEDAMELLESYFSGVSWLHLIGRLWL